MERGGGEEGVQEHKREKERVGYNQNRNMSLALIWILWGYLKHFPTNTKLPPDGVRQLVDVRCAMSRRTEGFPVPAVGQLPSQHAAHGQTTVEALDAV